MSRPLLTLCKSFNLFSLPYIPDPLAKAFQRQYPTVPSPEPVQSQQEIEREVVKKTTNNQLLIIALVVCMVLMVVHSWNTVQTTQNE